MPQQFSLQLWEQFSSSQVKALISKPALAGHRSAGMFISSCLKRCAFRETNISQDTLQAFLPGHCHKATVQSPRFCPFLIGAFFPVRCLQKSSLHHKAARTQGRAWLFYSLHSNCSRNPQGSWSNNHRAHYKISNAVPQIYIQLPPVWKDAPCPCCVRDQCSTRELLSALCCCSCSLPGAVSWQELLLREPLLTASAGAAGAPWTSGEQPLCLFSLRALWSHTCHEMYSKTQKFAWCQNQEEEYV